MLEHATEHQAAAPVAPPLMTYEEFLEWVDEETHAEWEDGTVVFMSPVTDYHQRLALWFAALLRFYVDAAGGGQVLTDPFQMKTGPTLGGRAPDVIFVAKEHLHRITRLYLNGPADVVIEVISKDSRRRDRHTKYREYQAGGVLEYWLLDPDRKRADFFRLRSSGGFAPVPLQEGIYRSEVLPGVWLKEAWLWQDPLPKLLDVLREWRLV